jgi:hypothetical protein
MKKQPGFSRVPALEAWNYFPTGGRSIISCFHNPAELHSAHPCARDEVVQNLLFKSIILSPLGFGFLRRPTFCVHAVDPNPLPKGEGISEPHLGHQWCKLMKIFNLQNALSQPRSLRFESDSSPTDLV